MIHFPFNKNGSKQPLSSYKYNASATCTVFSVEFVDTLRLHAVYPQGPALKQNSCFKA